MMIARSSGLVCLVSMFTAAGCGRSQPAFDALVAPSPGVAWSALTPLGIHIQRLDRSRLEDGELTFHVDLTTPEGALLTSGIDDLAVSIDGRWVPGAFTVTTAQAAAEPLALAVVMPNLKTFSDDVDPDGDFDVHIATEIGKGLATLVERVEPHDQVSLFQLDDDQARRLSPWSRGPVTLIPPETRPSGERTRADAPLNALELALAAFADEAVATTDRRVLVMVSEGVGYTSKTAEREAQMARIVALANGPRPVRLVLVGLTLGDPERFADLRLLAARSHGDFREIQFSELRELANIVAHSRGASDAQRIIRWRAAASDLPTEPSAITLELKSRAGRYGSTIFDAR